MPEAVSGCVISDGCEMILRREGRTPRISPGSPHYWWRRGDSCSISFETGWTMPSSFIASAMCRMRGVLSGPCDPDPSAGSAVKAAQPVYESLQGRKSWPRPTPRRCQVAATSDLRVHRMSPVFTSPSRVKATIAFLRINRTPVRKHYISGSTYVAVSLFSHLTLPEQQGRRLAS